MTKRLELEKLNLETSKIPWKDLQRFFAGGNVIYVSNELDMIEAAYQISMDNKDLVQQWMRENKIAKVTDDQAGKWFEADAEVWAVVVKPWILVQYEY